MKRWIKRAWLSAKIAVEVFKGIINPMEADDETARKKRLGRLTK